MFVLLMDVIIIILLTAVGSNHNIFQLTVPYNCMSHSSRVSRTLFYFLSFLLGHDYRGGSRDIAIFSHTWLKFK